MAKAVAKAGDDLLTRIRTRYKVMVDADRENRQRAMDDLKFALVPGEQWDLNQKKERGDRPCYEFNKIRITGKRIVNDMRSNRPQGKVRAVEDGDKATADALEGLTRNIWHVSDGDTVIDYAAEYQVFGGMGAWRVCVDWSDDTAWNQEICVEAIKNPFCLFADPACADPMKRDATDWILTEKITKDAFKAKWPKADLSQFEDNQFDDDDEWLDDETVRIAEYWYKEPVQRTLYLLSDGRTVSDEQLTPELQAQLQAEGVTVKRSRIVNTHDVYMCIASGAEILEKPTRWAGKEFPFVMVFGEWAVIDGKIYWGGITRFAKDAQRSYNVSRTAITETIALAPQAKYWATPAMADGNVDMWGEAHRKNFPFLIANADPKMPGFPQRMGGPDVPVALIQESQIASDEIKAVTGIFDASLGNRSNEQSGIAIRARQAQGEIATFNYSDNMAKGIRRTWELLVDLIPKIYDTERVVRVLGVDGAENYVKVNGPDPRTGEIVDLSRGKFDVAITVGPSFSTQRQEASEIYSQLVQGNPALFPIVGDLIMKSMDLPYSDKMAERLKAMLPPQIQQMESKDKPIPPEVQAAMAQVDLAQQQVQAHGQLVQQAAAEAEQNKAEAEKAQSALQVAQANFDARVAKAEADITKKLADLTLREAQSAAGEVQSGAAADRESLATEVQKAVADIQTMAGEFMAQAGQALLQIQAQNQPQVILNNPPPGRKVIRVKRVNGEMVGEVSHIPDTPAVQ